jgi:hypothetical protein
MKRTLVLTATVIGLVVLITMQLPSSSASTSVNYFSGYFDCQGTLIVSIHNATGGTKIAKVTFRHENSSVKPPVSGDGTLTALARSASSTTYDCSGSDAGDLQVRTSSTGVMPSAEFTLEGGPKTVIPAGAWRMLVKR